MKIPKAVAERVAAQGGEPTRVRAARTRVPVPEAAFQRQVIAYARLRGWAVAHFRKVRVQRAGGGTYWETPAAADGAGWPDLVLCRPPVLVFAELKAAGGRVEPAQAAWHDRLRAAGQAVYVWRPADWAEVERVLGAGRPHSAGRGSQ